MYCCYDNGNSCSHSLRMYYGHAVSEQVSIISFTTAMLCIRERWGDEGSVGSEIHL